MLKYIFIVFFLSSFMFAKGQTPGYQQVDSTSYSLYLSGNWVHLIRYGKEAVAQGIDFPFLRLRLGYAQFITGNYAGAISQYGQVLKQDANNQTANYYTYLCNSYLNREDAAYRQLALVDDSTFAAKPSPFRLISATIENSVKSSPNPFRGKANYARLELITQLGHYLQLDQSVAHFVQRINFRRRGLLINNSVKEYEYFGKLNYSLNSSFSLFGVYHYLNTQYRQNLYHNNLGIAGFKYSSGYTTWQADADLGKISGTFFQQYNAQLSVYPKGNLNLYFTSRGSVLQQGATKFVFSQTAGTKLLKHFWVEASVTFGTLENYLESDGLYVYNAIDITKFKTGGTGYYDLGNHLGLYVNYTLEKKNDLYRDTFYQQHSVTAGLTWKF
ncbi:hypothetical protein A0256_20430 [Mucilaginibacter sp. PAMC 26640]|nr:hypothetical protein A0256_20430 [Mucilaginibacter sp. PAMC 26640]